MNTRHRPQTDTPKLPRELSGEPEEPVVPIAAPPPPCTAVADESKCREVWIDLYGRTFGIDLAQGVEPNVVPHHMARAWLEEQRRRAGHHPPDVFGAAWQYGDIEIVLKDHRSGRVQSLGNLVNIDRICHYTGPDEWTIKTRER